MLAILSFLRTLAGLFGFIEWAAKGIAEWNRQQKLKAADTQHDENQTAIDKAFPPRAVSDADWNGDPESIERMYVKPPGGPTAAGGPGAAPAAPPATPPGPAARP